MDAQSEERDPAANRLSLRGKLVRGMIAVGVIVLALLLILVPASGAHLPFPWAKTGDNSVVQGQPPLQLTPGTWQQIDLPVSSSSISTYAVDPTHPGLLVLCSDRTASGSTSTSATVWRTENSGQTWRPLPVPSVLAGSCSVSAISGNPPALLLQTGSVETVPACSNAVFYLSTDLGMNWRRIPHTSIAPADSQGTCTAMGSQQHIGSG